jgi:hypothetical protein
MVQWRAMLAFACLGATFAGAAGSNELVRAVAGGAGGRASNGQFTVSFAAGMAAAGDAANVTYLESAGYWPRNGGRPVGAPESPLGVPVASALRVIGPTPFRGSVEFVCEVGQLGGNAAWLDIFDLAGRRVSTPFRSDGAPGRFRVTWDGRDESGRELPSAVYVARFVAGSEKRVARVVRLK